MGEYQIKLNRYGKQHDTSNSCSVLNKVQAYQEQHTSATLLTPLVAGVLSAHMEYFSLCEAMTIGLQWAEFG